MSLPINIEAEQSLLGAILCNNQAFHVVSDQVEPEHFFEPLHKQLFHLMRQMIISGKRANPVSLKTFLPQDQRVGNVPILEYLNKLALEGAPTIVNVPDWADIIRELATARAAIGKLQTAIEMLNDTNQPLLATLGTISQEMMGLEADVSQETVGMSLMDYMIEQVDHSAEVYQNKIESGFATGLKFVDDLTGPWFPGQLIVIGGGTKMGKTSLGMQCLRGLSEKGKKIDVFSFEMSGRQLASRELSKRAGISTHRQNQGHFNDREFEELVQQARYEPDKNIRILTKPMNLDAIERQIIRRKNLGGLDVVVVDHIGLVDPFKEDRGRSNWEQGEIVTRRLKMMGMKHGVTIVAMAQLKKNTMHHAYTKSIKDAIKACYRRPRYTDLIGGVERDTDHVLLPFRPEALIKELEPQQDTEDHGIWQEAWSQERGKAQVILALSRERDWPRVERCKWDGKKTEFSSDTDMERFI